MGAIDYWCNAFLPDRQKLWQRAVGEQDLQIKVREDADDSFAEPGIMVERMDALGIDALILPCASVPDHAGPYDYERYATSPEELEKLASAYPGRFVGLVSFDPGHGMEGVLAAARALDRGPHVGLQLHTHSFDRDFDHRDLYPFYALAAERALPVVMQAGASGGRLPSACGRPLGIDRPALYFSETRFVLSHTGWPWIDEAIAMAQKHPNVYLGTAAWPAHRWPGNLVEFLSGPGLGRTMFGTSFPVVGHRHGLDRIAALGLAADARSALVEGTARHVFALS